MTAAQAVALLEAFIVAKVEAYRAPDDTDQPAAHFRQREAEERLTEARRQLVAGLTDLE